MACKYTYKGITYNSKEEFINQVINPQFLGRKTTIIDNDLPDLGNMFDNYHEYIPYRENKLNQANIDRLKVISDTLDKFSDKELFNLITDNLKENYDENSKFLSNRSFEAWLGDIKVKSIRKDIQEYKEGNRFKGKDVLLSIVGTDFSDYITLITPERNVKQKENIISQVQPKTRRILEVQSDLFQKGRDKEDLVREAKIQGSNKTLNIGDKVKYIHDPEERIFIVENVKSKKVQRFYPEENQIEEDIVNIWTIGGEEVDENEIQYYIPVKADNNKNQFLQLLNKNNNWVTFFVKSIIQDSVKKGYEKVLFPSGNTSMKIEGHTTLEEFKKQKEDRIKQLKDKKIAEQFVSSRFIEDNNYNKKYHKTEQEAKDWIEYANKFLKEDLWQYKKNDNLDINKIDKEINQLEQELERVETEGFGALKPIYNFYENTVANVITKRGYNPVLITDEYGNTWHEVTLNQDRDTQAIYFSQALEHQKKLISKEISFNPNKQYSFTQVTLLRKRIGQFNEKNNTKHYFTPPKQVGQADLYTMELVLNHGRPENPELSALYFNNNRDTTAKDVLEKIVTQGSKSGIKDLASDLLAVLTTRASETPITLAHMQEAGVYTSSDDHHIKVNWSLNKEAAEKNMLHEISHALTVEEYENNPEFKKNIDALWTEALNKLDKEKFSYELSSGKEFIAGAFSNKDFVNELASIKGINENTPSLMTRFINLIKKLLGINHVSLLDNLFYELEQVKNLSSERTQSFRQENLFEDYYHSPLTDINSAKESLEELQTILNTPESFDNLLLDFDGTIVDTNSSIKNTLNITPKQYYFGDKEISEEDKNKVFENAQLTRFGKDLLNKIQQKSINGNKIKVITAGNFRKEQIANLLNIPVENVIIVTDSDTIENYNLQNDVSLDKTLIISTIKGNNIFVDDRLDTINATKNIENLKSFYYSDRNYPLTEEDIKINPKFDKIINSVIQSLESRKLELTTQYGTQRRETIERVKVINGSLNKLLKEGTIDNLVSVVDKDIEEAENILKKDYDDMEFFDLMEAKRILTFNQSFDQTLASEELTDTSQERLSKLRDKNNRLLVKFNKILVKKLNEASKWFGKEITEADLEKSYEDISSFKKQGLSLDTTHIPHLQLAQRIMTYRSRKTADELLKFENEKKGLETKFGAEEFKKIFDADRLITPFRNELFELERNIQREVSEVQKNPNSTKSDRAAAKNKLAQFYRNEFNYKLTDKTKALYEKELEQVTEANTFTDNNGNPEVNQLEIDKWIHENSWEGMGSIDSEGNFVFEKLYAQKKIIGNEEVYANGWYRFLYKEPVQKWSNPKYDSVKDLKVYKWYVDKIKYILNAVPHSRMVDLEMYDKFLNQVTLDLTKTKFSLENTWKGVKNTYLDWFTVGINAKQANGEDLKLTDEKGREKPLIRIGDLQEIQEALKAKTPMELLGKMYEMAVTYEHLVEIQPMLDVVQYKLDNLSALQNNKFDQLLNSKGNPIEVAQGLINASELLRYNRMAHLTGKTRTDDSVGSIKLTEHERALLASGEEPIIRKFSGVKTLDSIIDYTRLNLIGLKPFTSISNLVVGISSNYLWAARKTDFTDKDLDWALTKLFGNVWKFWTTLGSQVEHKAIPKEAQKIANLLVKFGVVPESELEDRTEYGKTSKAVNKFVEIMYKMQEGGENIIAAQILLAKMKRTIIKDLKGKDRHLYEAFDIDGNWNSKEFGEDNTWNELRVLNEEGLNISKLQAFRDTFDQIRYNTQGDYKNPILAKSKVFKRVLMMFRTWLPRAIYNRWSDFNPETNFKGRYTTIGTGFNKGVGFKVLGGATLVTLAKLTNLPIIGKYFGNNPLVTAAEGKYEAFLKESGLSDLDVENMRVNIRELQFIALTILLVAALHGLKDDDDDKELNFSINLATRLYQDLSFFASPSSAMNIIKNPIPIWPTIQNTVEVTGALSDYIFHNERDIYKRGFHKGDSKLGKELGDMFPVFSAYNSTMSTFSQVFGGDTYKYQK